MTLLRTLELPYVWHWRARPRGRKGHRCRVVCRGAMNSALVEFEDANAHFTVVSEHPSTTTKEPTEVV